MFTTTIPKLQNNFHDCYCERFVGDRSLTPSQRDEPETERQITFSETPPKPILNTKKLSSGSSAQLGLHDFNSGTIHQY
jgi:hypothetical protein